MSVYSSSSYQPQSVLGLDLPQFDSHDNYPSIYPVGDLEFESYPQHRLQLFPDFSEQNLLAPMFTPKTIHPRVLEDATYHFDNPLNSISQVDAVLTMPPQHSPLLLNSPISDLSERNTFSVPSTGTTAKSALPRDDREYVPSDSDEDGEYSPDSSRSPPRRRRATRTSTAGGRKARSATPASKSKRKTPYSTAKKTRQSPPSRVFQSQGTTAILMQEAINNNVVATSLKFQCPEEACDYKMGSKPRMPDFRRHLKAHLRDHNRGLGTGHICKGILVTEYAELSERQQRAILCGGDETYWIGDQQRIGGCQQPFSRGDALTRHVKSGANPCVGWVSGHLEGC